MKSGVNSLSVVVLESMIDPPMQLYIGLVGCKMGLEIIGADLQHRASKKAASAQKEAAYEASKTARDISAEDRKSTRLNSSHSAKSRMPSSA